VPEIVTEVPTGPILGEIPVTESDAITVNDAVLLEKPASLTVTEPLVVPVGTVTVMLVSLQAVAVAAMPLNNTWLPLELVPKPEPVNVIVPPIGAAGGAKLVMTGLMAVNGVRGTLAIELTVTLTGPVPDGTVAGTVATICESLQLVTVAAAPLKVIVLVLPWVAPKFDPAMVTEVPTPPKLGEIPLMYGVVPTVIETLSNVPVVALDQDPLATANPTYTFCVCAMLMV
jgi:hypothetical protein